MRLDVALRLGRVSNLPTVITNAMAGMVLAGAGVPIGPLALVVIAAGLTYVAGMFLNDAFDAEMDKVDQPFRPIPSGAATRGEVFAWGYGMLAVSVALFPLAGALSGAGWQAGIAGIAGAALAMVVVAYNRSHKENAFGPILMGGCRVLVYVAAALAVVPMPQPALWLGAAMLMIHVMGLTFVAKREGAGAVGRIWPFACIAAPLVYGAFLSLSNPVVLVFVAALAVADLLAVRWCLRRSQPLYGRAIPMLIAAISLLDAMLIAAAGRLDIAVVAAIGCPVTLVLQRWVRGT